MNTFLSGNRKLEILGYESSLQQYFYRLNSALPLQSHQVPFFRLERLFLSTFCKWRPNSPPVDILILSYFFPPSS